MEPVGGDLARHDAEFERVRWVPFEEAPRPAELRHRARARGHRRGAPRDAAASSRRSRARRARHDRRPPATRPARPCDQLHETALIDVHRALGARLIEFGGWLMPVQYTGILDEHRAVRERAGAVRPVAHGRAVRSRATTPATRWPRRSSPIRARWPSGGRSTRCSSRPTAGVIDDLIVYRLGPERFLVVANAGNAADVVRRARDASRTLAGGPRRPIAGDLARGHPGPARRGGPGAADRRRPRRAALLRDRRGPGRRRAGPGRAHRLHGRGRLRGLRRLGSRAGGLGGAGRGGRGRAA